MTDQYQQPPVDNMAPRAMYSSEPGKRKLSRKQRLVFTIVGVCVIGLLGLGVWLLVTTLGNAPADGDGPASRATATAVCDDELLGRAAGAIERADIGGLMPMIAEIEKREGAKNDPNCNFVAARYYLMVQDDRQATNAIAALQRVHDPALGYSTALSPVAVPINDLKQSLETVRANAEQTKRDNAEMEAQ